MPHSLPICAMRLLLRARRRERHVHLTHRIYPMREHTYTRLLCADVNGMFTADPRHVPRARLIRSLTYREAQELAAMGAKVLHPRCLVPAAHAGVPVEVRNTMDPRPSADMTVVSATGLDYHHASASSASSSSMRCGANTAAAGAASAVAVDGHSGDASGRRGSCGFGGGDDTRGGDTPRFEESSVSPPPAPTRSPSSSKIVYSSSDGFSGGRDSPYDGPSSSSSSWSPRNSVAAPPSAEVLSSVKPKVLAVARRKGVTLVNMSAFDMWVSKRGWEYCSCRGRAAKRHQGFRGGR